MTFYYAASEPQSFASSGSVTTTTTAGEIDTDYTRIGMRIEGTTGRYIGTLSSSVTIGASQGLWLHARIWLDANGNTTPLPFFAAKDSLGAFTGLSNETPGLRLYVNGTSSGTGVPRPAGNSAILDIHLTDTEVSFYLNGLLQDTVPTTALNGLAFETIEIARGNSNIAVSEVVVADTSTIGLRVGTNVVSGQGEDTAMAGAFEDIGEAITDDATFISSGAVGQHESFTTTTLKPIGVQLVPVAVSASVRGRQGTLSGGPSDFDIFVRLGTTRYSLGSATLPASFGAGRVVIADSNPATATEWGTEANNIQFGLTSTT